jgi:chromosome segregation ATPase
MDELTSLEQLEKRVEWLDNERRNDKTALASLQNRLTGLETENIALRKQLKEMEMEISGLQNQFSSLDKYDNRIERLNIDLTKQVRDVNERAEMNLNEAVKRVKLEIEANRRSLSEVVQLAEQLESVRNEQKSAKLEDSRLARLIEELKQKVLEVSRFDEEYRRSQHLLEENYRQENKRLTDMQGELAALRKRVEETRSRFDVFSDSFRSLDTRITELLTYEKDRRDAQAIFIEKVNSSLVDKEKSFRIWENRFEEIDRINLALSSQFEALEASKKAVDKSITGAEEVIERFERRINEISEIQRLNDERFRQEWNSFKGDDLKRWTNYLLGQEEQLRVLSQRLGSAQEELEALKDSSQKSRDDFDKLTRETYRYVQAILGAHQESIQNLAPLAEKKAQ